MLININDEAIKKSGKVSRSGISDKKVLTLAIASVITLTYLVGCVNKNGLIINSNIPGTNQNQEMTIEQQLDILQQKVKTLESVGLLGVGVDDKYSQADWDAFIQKCSNEFLGKISFLNPDELEVALAIFNIDYLSKNGEKILVKTFSKTENADDILDVYNSFTSRIYKWNVENEDSYINFARFLLNSNDSTIIDYLENTYVSYFINAKKDLPYLDSGMYVDVWSMFNDVSVFGSGYGSMEIGKKNVSVSELSQDGILVCGNLMRTICSICQNSFSAELDGFIIDLENALNSTDSVYLGVFNDVSSEVQYLIDKYKAIGEVDLVLQKQIFNVYFESYGIVQAELSNMGINVEEAKALYTLCNIDYFAKSLKNQNILNLIYADGIDIDAMFKLADSAISKIVAHNDSQATIENTYDMSRLVFANVGDAITLRLFAQNAYNANSEDANVATSAVNILEGYYQYPSDITVDYQTLDYKGNVINHSIDKNSLSKGVAQVVNLYTYHSVKNHKKAYGSLADGILILVDGSQPMLSESISLMVKNYCAENNLAVYDFNIGKTGQGQK